MSLAANHDATRLITLFVGLRAQRISECIVLVRNEPCAYARTAWWMAVCKCNKLQTWWVHE